MDNITLLSLPSQRLFLTLRLPTLSENKAKQTKFEEVCLQELEFCKQKLNNELKPQKKKQNHDNHILLNLNLQKL